MRWMKKLLLGIYIYMGAFFGVCLLWWMATGTEPSALIAGISAAVGVESVAAGVIRIYEQKQQNDFEKEKENGENEKQCELGTEIDQP